MLNIGVRGHDVTGAATPEALGRALEGYGVHAVQLALARSFPSMASDAQHLSPGMGGFVRRTLAEHGVEVAVLGCYFNMIHPDPVVRERGIERFCAHIAQARSFGTSIVASESGSVDVEFGYTEENFTAEAFEASAAVIKRLCREAERYGVTVGIEAGVNHPIHDARTFAELIQYVDSPSLGLVLDPTALIRPQTAGRQVAIAHEMLERFSSRACACHLVDFRITEGRIERCNLGEGVLPVQDLVQEFECARPCGYVICEFTTDDHIASAVRLVTNFSRPL
ncbi:MAG: sugar phosphate isomerase/epimerase family protein [Collinsella sp.]|nr:sugar phosphate isomerase/epimerase family protein [Collinsella sp.]